MAHDVFLSYSSKDKPIADGICANLEAAGIRCWIAPRDITAGEDWPTSISAAITKSKVMVLVFSANSNASADVSREIILAANYKLVIIPFKIEDIEPELGKQYYLARTHWLEAMNPPTRDQIKTLVETVRAFVPAIESSGIVQTDPIAQPPIKQPEIQTLPAEPTISIQPESIGLPPNKMRPVQLETRKRNWLRRGYLWIVPVVLLVMAGYIFWPKLQSMTIRPTPSPTFTETIKTQPVSTLTLAATAPRVVSTPTPMVLFSPFKTLQGHTAEVRSVAFSSDGRTLASGSSDTTIILWDIFSGTKNHTLTLHNNLVNSVTFWDSWDLFVSGSEDGKILLWSPEYGDLREPLKDGHTGGVRSLAFSPGGSTLASGSNDSTIILWDFQHYASGGGLTKLRTIYDHSSFVLSVIFSPTGHTLASGGYQENSVMLHDTANGTHLQTLAENGDILSLAFSPDGDILASASDKDTISLWDVTNWIKLHSLSPGTCVAFSPDGRILASGSRDGNIILWDFASGEKLQTLAGHSDLIMSVAFSPDGTLLASGSVDGTIKLWSLENQ